VFEKTEMINKISKIDSKNRVGGAKSRNSGPEQKLESRALAKGLMLLDHLAAKGKPLSLGELADAAGLGKPSTLRILSTLQMMGWLSRDSGDNYCLDREWPNVSNQSWLRRLGAAALPEMRKLNTDFAETITLAAIFEDHMRVVEVLDSPQVIRMANYKGRILPPYASSLGKAITAFQNPTRTAVLLQIYGSYQFTEKTVTDPRAIQAEMAQVRKLGYSCDEEETVIGGVCFGAPIRSADGSVAAAMSISQPKQRLTPQTRETLPGILMEAVQRVAAALGYR
jgi:IclR family acetate operon transcriptional repressor